MRRPLVLLPLVALFAACGDPVIVLGDRPGWMRLLAGVPERSGFAVDSLARATLLWEPAGVAIAADGVTFVAEAGNARILALDPGGGVRVVVDHRICAGDGCLQAPAALALDGSGRILVADPGANRLWRVEPASGSITAVAGTGLFRSSPDGAPAAEASLAAPAGVAVGADGIVYVSERGGRRVRSIGPDGLLETVAGTGTWGDAGDGGPAREALLGEPAGLALSAGRLYIADRAHHRVRRVDLETGGIEALAGRNARGFGGDGGPALAALLSAPEAVAVSAGGRILYIADTGNHRVRTVDLETGIIATFAGTGDTEWGGPNRPAGETAVELPGGLAISGAGVLVVASRGDHVVWRTALPF